MRGVLLPNLLASTFLIPANSKTVRIDPPAITPVPGAAGRINTLAAPSLPLERVGIELFRVKGTRTKCFSHQQLLFEQHQ